MQTNGGKEERHQSDDQVAFRPTTALLVGATETQWRGGWGTAHATTGRVLKRGLSACMLIMYPVKKERQGFVLILHCWPHRGIIRLASLSVSHLRWAATSLYAPIHSAQCFRRRDTGLYRSAAASPSSTSIFSA